MSVDLPAPLRPISPTLARLGISSVKSRNTTFRPRIVKYDFVSFSRRITSVTLESQRKR